MLSTGYLQVGPDLEAIQFEDAEVGVSDVGFAANARLFYNAWMSIKADGRYGNFEWTIKVDPDAVLVPHRLWRTLSAHTGEQVFVNNCGMFEISALYGSLEAITKQGLDAFFQLGDRCMGMLWKPWGEDLYLQKCFEEIGVGGVTELGVVSDQRCWDSAIPVEQGCNDQEHPAFHPFKSLDNWTQCWNETVQAEGDMLRSKVEDDQLKHEKKVKQQAEKRDNVNAAREAQAQAGLERRRQYEAQARAKAEILRQTEVTNSQKVDLKAKVKTDDLIVLRRKSDDEVEDESVDDTRSGEYAKALAKSNVVKDLLSVGDIVKVRDVASKRWRIGNVTCVDPLAVRPKGWTVGFTWDIIDLIPMSMEDNFAVDDRVVIAHGHDRAVDVAEGPLRPGDVAVVREIRHRYAVADSISLLVDLNGTTWWYRASSLTWEHPIESQTCKALGCDVDFMRGARGLGSESRPQAALRKLRGTQPTPKADEDTLVGRGCRCDAGCVSERRCCHDFVDTCLLKPSNLQRFH